MFIGPKEMILDVAKLQKVKVALFVKKTSLKAILNWATFLHLKGDNAAIVLVGVIDCTKIMTFNF
jgi:hypothetical protein